MLFKDLTLLPRNRHSIQTQYSHPERKDGSLMLKVAKVMSTPPSPFLIPLEAELSPFPEHFRADFMICLC